MFAEKILFIQTAFLGDAILSLPAIQKLKELNSSMNIDVLCIPETKVIFESSMCVNEAIVVDKKGKHKSIFKTYSLVSVLKNNGYNRIYSAHRSFRTALIVLLLGVRESYGFDNSNLMHVYKNLITYDINKHEVQRNLDLVGISYDDKSWKIPPKLTVNDSVKSKVSEFVYANNLSNGFVAISPGSVWETKRYPIEYFRVIIKHFIDKGNKVVVIGGKSEETLCDNLINGNENVFNAAGKFSVIESIELLKFSKLLISNDSAPTHMAMSAEIKTLTIYCSTIPEFGFYPYNDLSLSISFNDLKCKPCGIHGYQECPIKTFDCGLKLLPEKVILKAEEILGEC